jgi:DNA-binding CsgD family transcriptional regulator
LITNAGLCVTAGKFEQAAALLEESAAIISATGAPVPDSIQTYLAAYRGDEQLCLRSVQTTIDGATIRGEGFDITVAMYAKAILHNGLGQYTEALDAALTGAQYDDVGMYGYVLTELVEAAARSGEPVIAHDALDRLLERTEASGTDTALGLAARSRALTAHDPSADDDYQSAIAHLQTSPAVVYVARTHLVYGEWLRRRKRRADTRIQLRIAHDMFAQMGAEGFAHRARRELSATGETVHTRSTSAAPELTTQESHIARLAREGYTNPEIAGQLFISPRTVEWHLSKIFTKLGVTSRRELRNAPFDLP